MDDMATRKVDWSALDGLVPDALDQYWQLTLQFLSIAKNVWPGILAAHNAIEPAVRRDLLIDAEASRLKSAQRRSDHCRRLDRLDADHRKIPARSRATAAWCCRPAGPRYRPRRHRMESHRRHQGCTRPDRILGIEPSAIRAPCAAGTFRHHAPRRDDVRHAVAAGPRTAGLGGDAAIQCHGAVAYASRSSRPSNRKSRPACRTLL